MNGSHLNGEKNESMNQSRRKIVNPEELTKDMITKIVRSQTKEIERMTTLIKIKRLTLTQSFK